mmetsp:Transcript_6076/g.11513  ORF Transcript_6076/g.11513 Transcript_6076/m.11513 type:complete len:195 (-) Transcript_6076:2594-3178(-)
MKIFSSYSYCYSYSCYSLSLSWPFLIILVLLLVQQQQKQYPQGPFASGYSHTIPWYHRPSQFITLTSTGGTTTATTATANTSRSKRRTLQPVLLLPSPSPIQAIMCPGNDHCVRVARRLRRQGGIGVFAIRSPTVPKGQERIRIILHAHNTEDEVLYLVKCLLKFTLEEEEEEEEELEETHEQEQETECIRSKL